MSTEPYNLRTPAEIEDKIIYLLQRYHYGQLRISWYLWHYQQIKISTVGVYHVLKRHGMNRLLQNQYKRSIPQRYENKSNDIIIPLLMMQLELRY